jgi:hypothetical protein
MLYIAYIDPDMHLDDKCNDTIQSRSDSVVIIIKITALMLWKNKCVMRLWL